MSESNGTATRNRISRVFPKSNGSALEQGERNGNASGRQRVQHEGRTALSFGLGSRVRRVAMGVAAAAVRRFLHNHPTKTRTIHDENPFFDDISLCHGEGRSQS